MELGLEDIRQQFEQIIHDSQNIDDITIDAKSLFHKFLYAKSYFISLFDGLTYEYPEPVAFTIAKDLDVNAIYSEIAEQIYIAGQRFLDDGFSHETRYVDLLAWLEDNKLGLLDNQVVITDITRYENIIPEDIKKQLSTVKLFKTIKYFYPRHFQFVRAVQDACSRASQKKEKLTGTLCLSVHPLDFLSLSENAHGWRSCHALDGDYRAGNISYMVDDCTFIAYIKAKNGDTYQLPHFPQDIPWNSKKWRCLLYMSEDRNMMFAGRQYPFDCTEALDFVLHKVINSVFNDSAPRWFHYKAQWDGWESTSISRYTNKYGAESSLYHPYYYLDHQLIPRNQLMKDAEGALHFNDVLNSSFYTEPLYSVKYVLPIDDDSRYGIDGRSVRETKFNVGGSCNCLHCNNHKIQWESSFLCPECNVKYSYDNFDEISICPVCGNRYLTDDGVYNSRLDEMICPECSDAYEEGDY